MEDGLTTSHFEGTRIRPALWLRIAFAAVMLTLGSIGLHRGLNHDDTSVTWVAAIDILVTLILMVNFSLFHYVDVRHGFIRRFHWFGLSRKAVSIAELESVLLTHEVFDTSPVDLVRFTWSGGAMEINLFVYGESWIKPVLAHLQSHGTPIDGELLEAVGMKEIRQPLYDKPL